MLSVPEQVGRGILVCPVTRERLVFEDGALRTSDGTHRYAVVSGVPILLSDPQAADRYVQESSRMVEEYGQVEDSGKRGPIGKLRQLLARDYRIADIPEAVALTDADREELDRRLEAYYRDPTVGRPWPDVKARA